MTAMKFYDSMIQNKKRCKASCKHIIQTTSNKRLLTDFLNKNCWPSQKKENQQHPGPRHLPNSNQPTHLGDASLESSPQVLLVHGSRQVGDEARDLAIPGTTTWALATSGSREAGGLALGAARNKCRHKEKHKAPCWCERTSWYINSTKGFRGRLVVYLTFVYSIQYLPPPGCPSC